MRAVYLASALALSVAAVSCGVDGPAPDDGQGGSSNGSTTSSSDAVSSNGSGGMMGLPPTFTVEGVVVDENDNPVEGAIVLQGGKSTEPTLLTGADGHFSIELTYPGYGVPGIVATKMGYRSGGIEFFQLPDGPVTILTRTVTPGDNTNYSYEEPGVGNDPSTKFCGHCHEAFAAEFQQSLHRDAASDPFVQDLYAGVAHTMTTATACNAAGGTWRAGLTPGDPTVAMNKCYIGGGVLGDLNNSCGGAAQLSCDDPALPAANQPSAFGACADCHAPAISGAPGGRNLHEATELAFDQGVFCDVCHKVRDIDLTKPPGVGSDLRLPLQRPNELFEGPTAEYQPLFFGPLIDVPNQIMGASYQPKFKEAQFCAGCHQQRQPALITGDTLDPARWPDGLPVHSTYQEWLDGPYAQSETPCQFCHMPGHFDLTNTIGTSTVEDASITFGYPRPPSDIREHIFRGPLYEDGLEPRLIDTALFVSIDLAINGGSLDADVHLTNIGCGHAVPTGEPMRALLLLVTAEGSGCGVLDANGGMTVFDAGGALAQGIEGSDASTSGNVVTWPAGAALAQPGMHLRVVRPNGSYDDYTGVGFFANPALTAQDKGLPIMDPIGEAVVTTVANGQLTLSVPLTSQPGDVLYLGEAMPNTIIDGGSSRALAGAPGYAFVRMLVDSSGTRQVPHYRATDIASDNRIPPGQSATTQHSFTLPGNCTDATVRARVLYRPLPLQQAQLRGWTANDYIIADTQTTTAVP